MGERRLSSRIPITAFLPEHIRPHPYFLPPAGNTKLRFTAILTNIPENKILEQGAEQFKKEITKVEKKKEKSLQQKII